MYKIIKNYRNDKALRDSFNSLAEKTFGLNFENWYQNGFWKDNYVPYSVLADDKIVANVSVNKIPMIWHGRKYNFLQLGTVMTDENYRNQGFIRKLMEEIDKDYAGKADGIFLFANDSVLDFYPKFGFKQMEEFQYVRQLSQIGTNTYRQVLMDNQEAFEKLVSAMQKSTFQNGFTFADNSDLYMFYVSQFMQESVFYEEELDAWVIAEAEEGELLLHAVFADKQVKLEEIIGAFGGEVQRVTLGFTPADPAGYTCEIRKEEDCTFFAKGEIIRCFKEEKLMIPTLAHA